MLSGHRPHDKTRMNETTRHTPVPDSAQVASLGSLFLTFLKIGSTTFGGFMALISVVQNHAVESRKLLKQEDMLDGISLASVLPGPVAFNVVAYVGYRVRGWRGALVSVLGVSLPSFLLMLTLSYAYFNYGQMPAVGRLFKGFIPAVAAVIVAAAWNMGAKTIKGVSEAVLALAAFLLLLGVGGFYITVAIIAGGGLAGWLLYRGASPVPPKTAAQKTGGGSATGKTGDAGSARSSATAIAAAPLGAAPLLSLNMTAAVKLFTTFAGMSVLLFGGGYVFIPLMQQAVVEGYGWVTRQEFIDGIALGQVMPGPILISSAFIGYKVAGLLGAVAAATGMFGPPAIVMLVCTRFLDRIKQSGTIKAALRGIRPAVIGMIAAASIVVMQTAQPNWVSVLIFGAALLALFRFKIETAWIIPAAGAAGYLLY